MGLYHTMILSYSYETNVLDEKYVFFSHFPDFLSLVTAKQLTPSPALVFLGALSLVYLTTSDVYRFPVYIFGIIMIS